MGKSKKEGYENRTQIKIKMMKAVSIKQPWASLITHGIKDIENRMWRTHFRGRIFIHASGKPDKEPYKIFTNEQASLFIDSDLDFKMLQSYKETSRIIGEVDIIDCVLNHESIWAEKTIILGETINNKTLYDEGPIWNWVLANPVLYDKPILNVKGKLSFWEFNK